jgi:hypothetical protein
MRSCMDHSNKKWEPPRATNFDYLKAYVWAMVGNYEPLYKLYMEQEERTKVPGKWRNADSKTGSYFFVQLDVQILVHFSTYDI